MAFVNVTSQPNPDNRGVRVSASNSPIYYLLETETGAVVVGNSYLAFKITAPITAGDKVTINGIPYTASDDPGFAQFATTAIATIDEIAESFIQMIQADPRMNYRYNVLYNPANRVLALIAWSEGSVNDITHVYSPPSAPGGPFTHIANLTAQDRYRGMTYEDYTLWVEIYVHDGYNFGQSQIVSNIPGSQLRALLDKPFMADNKHYFDLSGVLNNEVGYEPPQLTAGVYGYGEAVTGYWIKYGEAFTPAGMLNKQRRKVGETGLRWVLNNRLPHHVENDLICFLGDTPVNLFTDGYDGTMETGISGILTSQWFSRSWDTFAHSGNRSFRATPDPNPPGGAGDYVLNHTTSITLEAGIPYRIGAWVSIDPGMCGQGADIIADWRVFSGFAGATITTITTADTNTTWVYAETQIIAAAGAESGTFQLWLSGTDLACTVDVWVDDITLMVYPAYPRRFLTDQPAGRLTRGHDRNWLYFLWHDNNPPVIGNKYIGVVIKVYGYDGSSLTAAPRDIRHAISGLNGFRVDPEAWGMEQIELFTNALVESYDVYVVESPSPAMTNAVRITEIKHFVIDRKCDLGAAYNFVWLEGLGGFTGLTFTGETETKPDRSIKTFERGRQPGSYSEADQSEVTTTVEYQHVRKSNSGLLDRITYEWLRDSIMESPAVYVLLPSQEVCDEPTDVLYPVIIEGFSATDKNADGNFNLEIQWRPGEFNNVIRN